ncbi:hypothetical protein [Algibacter mikhailovii]|uniref:hypothetical protein n=1 Tax=Algibacter mikhailovii TaxID=425498 RepID=UPI002493FE9C|nr:hypothetical protein [Algibacter mikhailovii]
MIKYFKYSLALLLLIWNDSIFAQEEHLLTPADSTKSGYQISIGSGAPTNKDVEMQLNDYALPYYRWDLKYMNSWFDWKKKLNKDLGLQISINYSSIYMGATSKLENGIAQNAASGIFDATLKWNFINRKKEKDKGSFIIWTDWRHLYYGTIAPQFLFLETGSGTMNATKFNKWNFHVLEFYYQQSLFNDRMDIVVGKIDMPDWFAFNGLAHPMLHFTDLTFSVGPTVSWSNPGFGIAAGGWLNKKRTIGLVTGLNDVAGVDLNNPSFFDLGTDQWKNGNFLKMVELNYSPSSSRYYFNRIAITAWHSDALIAQDESFFLTPSSKGISMQATWVINDKIIPVAAIAFSDGEGANTLSNTSISLSNAWYFPSHDLMGVGVNYSTSSISGRSQVLSEVFYRWTLSKTTSFTPLVKFVMNPALDPTRNFIMYYGLRGRISL